METKMRHLSNIYLLNQVNPMHNKYTEAPFLSSENYIPRVIAVNGNSFSHEKLARLPIVGCSHRIHV